MSDMHDPLKDVDPWDHVQKRRLWQESAQAEYSRVFREAPEPTFHNCDFSQAEINAMVEALNYLDQAIKDPSYYELESGQVLRNVHSESTCKDQPCAIHHPSQHALHDRPRSWRNDLIYRTCQHGVAHPDFDSLANRLDRQGWLFWVHRCCEAKCCGIPHLVEIDAE